jgi:hypothetical protein
MLTSRPSLAQVPGLYRLVLEPRSRRDVVGLPARATQRRCSSTGEGERRRGLVGGQSILVHATLLVDADLVLLDRLLRGPGAPQSALGTDTQPAVRGDLARSRSLRAAGRRTATAWRATAEAALWPRSPWRRSTRPCHAQEAATAGRLMRDRYGRPDWHMGTS